MGKHRILVKCWTSESIKSGVRSEWFVVDLIQKKIVMKHPHAVWSNNYSFVSMAALHEEEEGTLSILNVGVKDLVVDYDNPPTRIPINEELDYIHSSTDSDTCISTLDFTITPPTFSNWKLAPKINLPYFALLHNKIFAFHGTTSNSTNPKVYQIGGDDDDREKITSIIPFGGDDLTIEDDDDDDLIPWEPIQPISDPKKNRFIAYFPENKHSLYAYYPEIKEWQLLHHLDREGKYFFFSSIFADQVVLDKFILCLNRDDEIFVAYNILTNQWLDVVVVVDDGSFKFQHPPGMYFGCYSSKLVHLGNDILCLAIPEMAYRDQNNFLQFLRFKVNHVKEEKEIVQLIPLSLTTISTGNMYGHVDTIIPF